MNNQKSSFLDTFIGIIELVGIFALILFCGLCIMFSLLNPQTWGFIIIGLLISAIGRD